MRVNFTLVRDFNYGGFESPVKDLDELEATRVVAVELMRESEKWRARISVFWRLNASSGSWSLGVFNAPRVWHSKEEGHGVLCEIDEAMRLVPLKS